MSYPWIIVGIGNDWRAENAITGVTGPRRPSAEAAGKDLQYLADGGEPDALFGMDIETLAALEEDASEVTNEDWACYARGLESVGSIAGHATFL